MSFNDNASLDTSRMGGGGGGGRGPVVAGGGLLGLVVLVLSLFFPSVFGGGGGTGPQGGGQSQGFEECETGADANRSAKCRMVGGENSLVDFWSNQPSQNLVNGLMIDKDIGQCGFFNGFICLSKFLIIQ